MTCANRFNRWRNAGHWARILQTVSQAYDGEIQVMYRSSIRIHEHGAHSPKSGVIRLIVRSRAGLTTMTLALVDVMGRPYVVSDLVAPEGSGPRSLGGFLGLVNRRHGQSCQF